MRRKYGRSYIVSRLGAIYISSKDVVVWTNNVILKYFATQAKLSLK
jgi:hypothetical protein